MSGDRIPCINPRCRRTAAADRYDPGTEIICGKCLRALPSPMLVRWRQLKARQRRVDRKIDRRLMLGRINEGKAYQIRVRVYAPIHTLWGEIKRRYATPDKPAGLDTFLREIGLGS